jgi:hypothetical protein
MCEHPFVDPSFKPYGHTDPSDTEGSAPQEVCEQGYQLDDTSTTAPTGSNPNSIKICLPTPASQHPEAPRTASKSLEALGLTACLPIIPCLEASRPTAATVERLGVSGSMAHLVTSEDSSRPLTIRIPMSSLTHRAATTTEDEPDEEASNGWHTFCPMEHCDTVINMMEHHFCTHPLIPGYSAPTPEGIKAWAVKQMYEYCVLHDLPNLWAYPWENWYRHGQWEHQAPEEIPHLKTTMMVEAQCINLSQYQVYKAHLCKQL